MTTPASYLLSVVIPVGPMNGRLQALQKTINESQNLPLRLILVCDDYKDGTKEELEKILSTDTIKNVDLISGQFNGPGRARTAGLALTTAPWVAFWDADDYPDVDESLTAIRELQDPSTSIICNQYAIHDNTSMKEIYRSLMRNNESENLQAIGSQPGIWRFLFKNDLILGMDFADGRMGEDQEFLARVLAKNPKIEFTNHQSYQYLVSRVGQLTGDKSNIAQLVDIVPLLKASYLTAPARYKDCLNLMLNQIILTMAIGGEQKVKLTAARHIIANPVSFTASFLILLREKRLRNG